ncbi:MAG: tRNA lysidine(34) synthetase TilS [Mycoplasmoidaceae bacterium]|nr:tRNA lysidine(34) synthetase TilS [Mycoplasmoidaceae bacterium]
MSKKLAAVSGGPDSMALLNKYQNDICAVCHVNYQKRKTANRDEKIVKDFCKTHKIDLYIKKVNKSDYEKSDSSNFQDSARKIRYNFFKQIANKLNCHSIYVAHNKDDFIETAYRQIQRNSSSLFYGIKKNNEIDGLKIIRPLIDIRKNDLQEYCDKHNIQYGIDETNFSDIYERNKIRKIIAN